MARLSQPVASRSTQPAALRRPKKKRRVAEATRRKGTRKVPLGGDKQINQDLSVSSADPQPL